MTAPSLVEFLLARIAEDEAWADACEGLHWEWRGNELDDLVTPDPAIDEYIDGESVCSLRSVETFPYGSMSGEGPRFLIHSAEDTLATAAGHIARHDPARVLRECEAKRQIIADWASEKRDGPHHDSASIAVVFALRRVLRIMATEYADHPDYRYGWRP